MILVTGATGFIGRALVSLLVESRYDVRILLRPSPESPTLPKGTPLEVAVSSLADERSLRAAMVGVEIIFHLAGAEWRGAQASLMQVDIQGTRQVVRAAQDAGVKRIYYLSHLGADRASAYPVMKAKGIAEEFIRESGLDYTILRSAIVFGQQDGFTTGIASILLSIPLFFLLPGSGNVLLQPLWIEDLVTCMVWSLENQETLNRTIEIGGPEFLSFRQIVELVMRQIGVHRRLVPMGLPYLRALTVLLDTMLPHSPVSTYWLDYLAVNRTTSLDTLPRVFNLNPSRLAHKIGYLRELTLRRTLRRAFLGQER